MDGARVQVRSPCRDSITGDMAGPTIRIYVHRGSELQTRTVALSRIVQTDTREIWEQAQKGKGNWWTPHGDRGREMQSEEPGATSWERQGNLVLSVKLNQYKFWWNPKTNSMYNILLSKYPWSQESSRPQYSIPALLDISTNIRH